VRRHWTRKESLDGIHGYHQESLDYILGFYFMLEKLLEKSTSDTINARNDFGFTPLYLAMDHESKTAFMYGIES
jgi:hypothetical protein